MQIVSERKKKKEGGMEVGPEGRGRDGGRAESRHSDTKQPASSLVSTTD